RHCASSAACLLITAVVLATPASAVTIKWTGTADNASWNLAGNWDLNRLPHAGDDVVIPDVAGTTLVTYSQDTTQVKSISTSESLTITGGTLEVTGNLSATKDVTLSGGTLKTARFTSSNSSRLLLSAGSGTLDNVTIAGTLEADAGSAYIVNGL